MISLTRRYRFAASHRLHVAHLSAAQNQALFGKCNNPFGHGHNYVLSVTVTGAFNPHTGLFAPVSDLDRYVEEKVLRPFAHRNLNLDLPQFEQLVPTTENVSLVIAGLLEEGWASWFGVSGAPRLSAIHLQETDRNGFTLQVGKRRFRKARLQAEELAPESVMVNG